jgi:tyrosine-protein kinase Etk/Wzc
VTFLDRIARVRALPWVTGGALFALVVAWTLLVTPLYRSTALVQVSSERPGGGLADAVSSAIPGGALLGLSKDELETQVGVLRSRRVVDAVIDSLALMVRVAEPGLSRASLVDVLVDADGTDVEGTLRFTRANGGWTVAARDLTPAPPLPTDLRAGDTLRVGGVQIIPLTVLGAPEVAEFTLSLVPRFVARNELMERYEVRRQSAGAQLITLSLDDPDPVLAAAILERVLAEFLDFTARTARGDAGTTAAELRRQIDAQQSRLTAAEEALRRYQEATGLVLPEEQGAAQVERYAKLRATLDALEVERDALARLLAIVNARAASTAGAAATDAVGSTGAEAFRQLATFPSLITNRAIQDLLLALTTLENDRSELRLVRTDNNADVRQLTARIEEIERQLQRLGTQYLESLDEQIAPTASAIAALDAELVAMPERELRFIRLYRERTILSEGYLFLQKQLRQTELQDALRLDQVRVVDAPSVSHPDDPYFPRPLVNLVLGLVLAVSAGGAVAALQSSLRGAA